MSDDDLLTALEDTLDIAEGLEKDLQIYERRCEALEAEVARLRERLTEADRQVERFKDVMTKRAALQDKENLND